MKRARRHMAAGKFKANCLKVLDQVAETKEVIVVTKRGRPVAKVVPLDDPDGPPLRGSVRFLKEIVSPIGEAWEAAE